MEHSHRVFPVRKEKIGICSTCNDKMLCLPEAAARMLSEITARLQQYRSCGQACDVMSGLAKPEASPVRVFKVAMMLSWTVYKFWPSVQICA